MIDVCIAEMEISVSDVNFMKDLKWCYYVRWGNLSAFDWYFLNFFFWLGNVFK